jgi:hypothetical protein
MKSQEIPKCGPNHIVIHFPPFQHPTIFQHYEIYNVHDKTQFCACYSNVTIIFSYNIETKKKANYSQNFMGRSILLY